MIAPLQHAADFAKLSAADLHYADPAKVLAALLAHIADLAKAEPVWVIDENLERSPLYQAYVDTGNATLNDPTADATRFGMSREEFEAFVDFRKSLDAL